MNPYQEKCIIKLPEAESTSEIDQHSWYVIEADRGGFGIPKDDWDQHHSQKWFKYVRKNDVAVQAGGCMGVYPRLLSERFQVVYTFEPAPLNFYCLVNNCQRDNIVKIQAALGAKPGGVELQLYAENVGMNKISNMNGFFPVVKLDSFELPACDLMAFDMELYEYYALLGARQTILKHNPVVILENGDSEEIKYFMEEIHYEFVELSGMDSIYIRK